MSCFKKLLSLLVVVHLLSGCSLLGFKKEKFLEFKDYEEFTNEDYLLHLEAYGKKYLEFNRYKILKQNKRTKKYLSKIASEIMKNNSHLILEENFPQVVIIREKTPFHFSLPDGTIVLSLGLLKKYVENEGVLVSILSYELIKTKRGLYRKQNLIPIGYVELPALISILRLNIQMRSQLNKWAFLAVKRAGYDEGAYLVWLQTQNKNSLGFSIHHGGIGDISKEEFLFKRFLIKNGLSTPVRIDENHSSREFYRFKHLIRQS